VFYRVDKPPVDPVLEEAIALQWVDLRPRLLDFARGLTRSRDVGRDLVDDAYIALREGRRTWNRDKQPDLFDFAVGVLRSLWSNDTTGARAKLEIGASDHQINYAPTSAPNPEQLSAMKEEHEHLDERMAKLRALFEEGDPCRELLALYEEGVDGAAEQAARLGLPVDIVYAARKRLQYALLRERKA